MSSKEIAAEFARETDAHNENVWNAQLRGLATIPIPRLVELVSFFRKEDGTMVCEVETFLKPRWGRS
jgi:hypothetical protein